MTLLVALRAHEGLVLAADSRGTFGDPRGVTAQNDSQEKARSLTKHVAVLQAGAGELGTNIIGRARSVLENRSHVVQDSPLPFPGSAPAPVIRDGPGPVTSPRDGVTPVMSLLRDVTRASYQEWFSSIPAVPAPGPAQAGQTPVRPDLQLVIGGFEVTPEGQLGEARIYSMVSALDFAPNLHDYGFAVAGIPMYALYLLNRLYQPGRTVEDLTALAVYVITETASQDGKVGGPVSVIQIVKGDGCRVLSPLQVHEVVADNELRSAALRDSFYEHGDGDGASAD